MRRILVVVAVALLLLLAAGWRSRKERFFGALIKAGIKVGTSGVKAGADQAADQKASTPTAVQPSYRGRYNDGIEWVCPDDTVETGGEDAKGCITSPYHPPVWKAGPDGTWAHLCPNGTVPTPESDWNKKCEVGWTARVYSEDAKKWACPWGTWDSGKDWGDGWYEGQKQCKRSRPYTTRIMTGGKWTCPAGTKDTGKGWDLGKDNGWKQCKWMGP